MSKCLKGKSEVKAKDATTVCKKCGALTSDPKHVCRPEKIKASKKSRGDMKKSSVKKIERALEKLKKAEKELKKALERVEKAREKVEKAKVEG